MPIVVSVENENGEQTYEAFDPAKHSAELASLPADVIATHPEYQRLNGVRESVVKESKKFKERAQTAEQRLQTLLAPAGDSEDEQDNNDQPPNQPKQKNPASNEKPLSREEIVALWDETQRERASATQSRQQQLEGLITKHGIKNVPDVMAVLDGAADPAKTAEVLGRSASRFDEVSGGNPDNKDFDLEGLNAARRRMGLAPKQS